MAFKLVIDNKINTRIKGFYKDAAGVSRAFNFELVQERVDQEELQKTIDDKNEKASDFIRRTTSGWKNQRLVLNEDDQPAEFSPEALDALLNVAGMGGFCFQAYLAQVLVSEKN